MDRILGQLKGYGDSVVTEALESSPRVWDSSHKVNNKLIKALEDK